MDARRALRRLLVVALAFFGLVIGVGLISEPDGPAADRTTRPAAVSSYSHADLQDGANMTQEMSTSDANTGAPVHTGDSQLWRAQSSPAYVRALEQHQADIERMLARETP